MKAHRNLDPSSRTGPDDAAMTERGKPRVVILSKKDGSKVEILELPESASLGDLFCHSGTKWQVTATRTGNRVLIARPVEA